MQAKRGQAKLLTIGDTRLLDERMGIASSVCALIPAFYCSEGGESQDSQSRQQGVDVRSRDHRRFDDRTQDTMERVLVHFSFCGVHCAFQFDKYWPLLLDADQYYQPARISIAQDGTRVCEVRAVQDLSAASDACKYHPLQLICCRPGDWVGVVLELERRIRDRR
jgi:hypothetical protein